MSSLNLRYHNLESARNCITILSMEPQYRTIFIQGRHTFRVPFPYLLFIFKYKQVPGGYLYEGLQGPGLSVAFTNTPVESFTDIVYGTPLEHHGFGSCTDHAWDSYVFKNPRVLIGTILEIWWSSAHNAKYEKISLWANYSIKGALGLHWPDFNLYGEGYGFTKELRGIVPFFGDLKRTTLINKPLKTLPSIFNKVFPTGDYEPADRYRDEDEYDYGYDYPRDD